MTGKQLFCKFAAVAALSYFSLSLLQAQRLPEGVKPEHYTIALTPDISHENFTGSEVVDVVLSHPSNSITLNAAEIKFGAVAAKVGGKTIPATVTLDAEKEQATFAFAETLPAGPVSLSIEYSGILNGQLRGFYLSKTAKRNYAVTQFEPTDARRAFPSFDEPAYKATFDVSLTVDKGDTAISNTNVLSDTPVAAGEKHTLKFATTPKMSTYLLAFLVGDFQCVSGESEGVPIRACATPDKVQMGKFAVTSAEYFLHYYNQYFGIKYPMPKLDMIAIPDFEAGAMENFGAITYRETDLLIDDKTASIGGKKRVAIVVAHEMAHQWFGDMVTMQWWDNVWLNEGFASWMETKAVASWKPEWKMSESIASELNGTLNLDSQRKTRTIRATADTPAQINEMFDGISYGKAGAVLSMVENYLGEEVFRQGVHNYLSAHMYGNATAEDFWGTQTSTSHKPIDKIMSGFISQPGVPVVEFSAPGTGKVEAKQDRFFVSLNPPSAPPQQWVLPICFKVEKGKQSCSLLEQQTQVLSAPKSEIFFANAGGKGYYRFAYPEATYTALLPKVETELTPEERINLLGNQWALMRSGRADISSYLDLAAAVKADPSPEVIGEAIDGIVASNSRIAATEEEKKQLSAWVRKTFAPTLASLGNPIPNEPPQKTELRSALFSIVGGLGRDPETIAKAKDLASKYLANPESVDPNLAPRSVSIAAQNGDSTFYDAVLKVSQTSNKPQVASGALFALTSFTNPALVRRTLDYATSGKVRNQDSLRLIASLLSRTDTQQIAWPYIQENWEKVQAQMTTWAGAGLISAASSFCSADVRDQIVGFFTTHKVPASERAMARMQDQINDCIDLRKAQEPKLQEWLKKNQ